MAAASLIDTNILVYRFDPRKLCQDDFPAERSRVFQRFPQKQAIATRLLREGFEDGFGSYSTSGGWNLWRW